LQKTKAGFFSFAVHLAASCAQRAARAQVTPCQDLEASLDAKTAFAEILVHGEPLNGFSAKSSAIGSENGCHDVTPAEQAHP